MFLGLVVQWLCLARAPIARCEGSCQTRKRLGKITVVSQISFNETKVISQQAAAGLSQDVACHQVVFMAVCDSDARAKFADEQIAADRSCADCVSVAVAAKGGNRIFFRRKMRPD